jgi:hypothetical protein
MTATLTATQASRVGSLDGLNFMSALTFYAGFKQEFFLLLHRQAVLAAKRRMLLPLTPRARTYIRDI